MKKNKKKVELNPFSVVVRKNGFVDGVVSKRYLSIRECRHILMKCLGIDIQRRSDFDCKEEYDEYNEQLKEDVTDWLDGVKDDQYILDEYAADCSDEPLGIWNAISVLQYLQKIEAI